MSRDNPRHGTSLGYAVDKCRNECCRALWRKYQNDRTRAITYGRYEPRTRTDPSAAQSKILELRASGLSNLTISKSTGVSEGIIELITNGSKKWIYPETERRILAFKGVTVSELSDRARMDSTGTTRRIQALCAIGWTFADIAERMGCTARNVSYLADQKFTRAATVRAVAEVFDELWDKPAPTGHRRARALALAGRKNWAPPLAWDDIDDPAATPNIGKAAIRPGGGAPIHELIEDVEWLLETDPAMTTTQIAARLGYADKSAVQNALSADRGNRPDLLARLKRNAEMAA